MVWIQNPRMGFSSKHSTPVKPVPFSRLGHRDVPCPSGRASSTEEFLRSMLTLTTSVLGPSGGLWLGNKPAETCLQLWAGMFRNVLECLLSRQEKPRTLGKPQGVGSWVRCSWWQVSPTVTSEFRKQSRENRQGPLISTVPQLTEVTEKVIQQGETGRSGCEWHFI